MNDTIEGSDPNAALPGRYANYCQVGQNAMEFVIDFGQRYGEVQTPLFHTRIVTTPFYMKAILAALKEAMDLYERRFLESSQGME